LAVHHQVLQWTQITVSTGKEVDTREECH
jgi:hypothetical protein